MAPVTGPTTAPATAGALEASTNAADEALAKTPLNLATPAESQVLGAQVRSDDGSIRFVMIGLALLVLGGVALWLKRRAARAPGYADNLKIETLATSRVWGKHTIGIVRVGGRILVLGMSEKGVNLLTELDEPELNDLESAEAAGAAPSRMQGFADRISQARQKLGTSGMDPFRAAMEEEAPVDELFRLDERTAIRERLDTLRRRRTA